MECSLCGYAETEKRANPSKNSQRYFSSLAFAGAIISTFFWNYAFAQTTPDTSLGAESSVVTPNVVIKGIVSDQIDGGAIRGINLFHSFKEFNIRKTQGVYFSNPTGIRNILSRVTGANRSNILGTLGVLGNANLFLINPKGIIFGPNASLDVAGSFVATTANAFQFDNQGFFSATAPDVPPILTVNPSALLFNQIASGTIKTQSIAPAGLAPSGLDTFGLRVPDGRSLLLVGGDISVDGLGFRDVVTRNSGGLKAFGGRIELGGLAGAGTIGLNVNDNELRLDFPEGVARANVFLTNNAEVNVRAGGGGDIAINAWNLKISEGSSLLAGIESGLGSSGTRAGNITLNATGDIIVTGTNGLGPDQSTRIRNNVGTSATDDSGAIGDSGNIIIQTGTLTIENNVRLSASTFGKGNAGSVSVQATGPFSLSHSFVASAVSLNAIGNAGGINVEARSLSLTEGAQLITSTFGKGNAGSVSVRVNGLVSLTGRATNIYTTVESGAVGNGGNITIKAGTLSLRNGSQLQTRIRGTSNSPHLLAGNGNAGNVIIHVRDTVTIAGVNSNGDSPINSGILSTNQGTGNAGSITLQANSLNLDSGALISATNASSEGGNITLDTQSLLLLRSQSFISTSTGNNQNGGNGGNITINTPLLVAVPSENSDITANAFRGNGGNINITAKGIFGIQRQEGETSQSDITASSKLGINGVVNINTSDVDPSRGLVALAKDVVDVAGLMAQTCPAGRGQGQSEFIVTGRGGLPDNPTDTLSTDAVQVDLVSLNPREELRPSPAISTNPTAPAPAPLVEAQGWVINDKGEVVLTAHAPNVTPNVPWMSPANCHSSTSPQQPLALGVR